MSCMVRDPREITFELLMHTDAREKLYVKFIMKNNIICASYVIPFQ